MWFLLLQITALLVLAAAAGAGLMWWFMRRREADTAEARDRIPLTVGHIAPLATREDMEKDIAAITALISSQKPVDLLPLEERLSRLQRAIAELRFPVTDLAPVNERLGKLEQRLAAFSLDPVMTRVGDVQSAVAPVAERLSRVEAALGGIKLPDVDLGPVHSGIASLGLAVNGLGKSSSIDAVTGRIAGLEARLGELGARLEQSRRNDMDTIAARFANITTAVAALKMPDLQPLHDKLGEMHGSVGDVYSAVSEVHGAVGALPPPDIGPVHTKLAELQAAVGAIPRPDLRPLQMSLSNIEATLRSLDKPPTDLGPLHQQIAGLETALQTVQGEVKNAWALAPLDRRLASMEEALAHMPPPDLDGVIGAVRAIDSRHDLVAMENRLTAIEYGLAAVHHMLRARENARAEPVREARNGSAQITREAPPAPARPARESDPINGARKPDDQANLLATPAFGAADDLEAIDGVGPMLRSLLNDIGVYYFWQVAEWTPDEINWVESKLMHFRGRIRRDDWVGHARQLAAAPGAARRPGPGGNVWAAVGG